VRGAVVEREHVEFLRLLEPDVDQLLQLVLVLRGEVVRLRAVLVGVEELPLVLVELPIPEVGPCTATAFQPFSQMPRVPSIA
jgi:hypothetical protein